MDKSFDANKDRGEPKSIATDPQKIKALESISSEVRRSVFETVLNAQSGHLGASSSSAELMVSFYFGGILNYDPKNPKNEDRDRVLVRGHVGPLRYKIFSLIGWIPEEELKSYRQLGSRLQGHEAMEQVPGVDITPSGSLGMILSYGAGSAIAAKNMGKGYKTYVFLGDGEEQEGNISEAARHIANLGLNNIVVILDKNEKQLSGPNIRTDSSTDVRKVWEGYGWDVKEIKNGHSIKEILEVFEGIKEQKKPTMVIAHTIKGLGLIGSEENFCGYHTISSITNDILKQSLGRQTEVVKSSEIDARNAARDIVSMIQPPLTLAPQLALPQKINLTYSGKETNLTGALTEYLQKLHKDLPSLNFRFYAADADIIKMPDALVARLIPPTIYLDVGVREQHLVALGHGLSVTDKNSRVFINVKDAFIYRSSDQLNAVSQASTPLILVSDDAGLSGGKNGPTHQSSGQPGALLTMPNLKFLEPADGTDLFNCLNWAFNDYSCPVYIRTSTATIKELPVEKDKRNIDYYIALEPSRKPDIVIVGSGFPVSNSIEAADQLKKSDGLNVRVVNVINMKSLNSTFANSMLEHNRPVLTVYNGNQFVLRAAVATAAMDNSLAVPSKIVGHGFNIGTSGAVKDLIREYKLDSQGIAELARKTLG